MPTYALSLLGRTAREQMAATLPAGLRLGHLAVLGALDGGPPRAQRELAEALSIHPSDMVALVDDLRERRLVRRDVDPADRRRKLVSLTPAGRRLLVTATADSDGVASRLLAALEPHEQRTVLDLLRRALGGTGR